MEAETISTAQDGGVPAHAQTLEMRFDAGSASVVPSTANATERTVDVVWYGGASVARMNRDTGKPYSLRLDMAGCNMDRLNAGAAVFDNHMSGSDFVSAMANSLGTKAQIGVVLKAWASGTKGMATLKFAKDDPAADAVWNKVASGIIQNLSFGTWINEMEPDESVGPNGYLEADTEREGQQSFVATKWEPFEISPVCVPADFSTAFLSAEVATPASAKPISLPAQTVAITTQPPAEGQEIMRASAREENTPAMEQPTQAAGAEARTEQLAAPVVAAPVVNTEAVRQEAIRLERERVQSIRLAAQPFAGQLDEKFVNSLADEGLTLEAARTRILEQLAARTDRQPTRGEVVVTRDQNDSRRENMEAALLFRHDPKGNAAVASQARDYAGFKLIDIARECLDAKGVKTRGMGSDQIAKAALLGHLSGGEYFATGMASTSDFPNILANVANKSMRQAYEAAPQTFKAFSRMVTATDFKPLNRVQLSDISALQPINESGEFRHTSPSDSKETYALATYGEIVALTRKTVINDDLQAFTRIPALMGQAAATLESNTVWALFTGNPTMADTNAVFHANHSNLLSGAGSALSTTGLGTARASMRLQTAPKGTILNLTPKFILLPAALETTADQLVSPINIASSSATNVVPSWIRSLNPIIEPRLDANSTTAWYLVADPAAIDGIEFAYLEGQQGVYMETRQGFEVDGLELKCRLDFGCAVTEYRGLLKSAGA